MEYLISGATVLYGKELNELQNHVVWIKDKQIFKVLRESEVNVGDLPTYHYPGLYLLPGLVDHHVHVMWDGSEDPVATHEKEGYEQMIIRAVANCQEYIKQGITTIRDLGSINDIALHTAKAINRGLVHGPRLIASGRTLTMTGGHDPFWGRFCDGTEESLKATREQIFKGAKVIKVSATGGVYGREEGEEVDHVELTYEELKTICEEAHRFDLKVASHAIGRQGILNSIKAGVDTIEHGHFLDEKMVTEMIEHQISWIPTLYIYQQIAREENIPLYAREKAEKVIARHEEAFKSFFNSGVRIGAGSDAGACNTPHPSLIEELETMEHFVSNNKEVLKTATTNAGEILGLNIGQIKEGYEADFIILKQSPLKELSALRNVSAVYRSGRKVV